jgi:uncharacterized protein YacL
MSTDDQIDTSTDIPPVRPATGTMYRTLAEQEESKRRAHKLMLLTLRLLYLVLMVPLTMLPFVAALTDESSADFPVQAYIVTFVIVFAFGLCVILLDTATPNKKLSSVFGIYLGIVAGLVATFAIGLLLDLVWDSWNLTDAASQAYLKLVQLAIGVTLCYVAVSIVISTKDDFRLVIPYVEFSKQVRGIRPLLLDTSVLVDGRIEGLSSTGFLDAPLVLPQFVIAELQTLSDSGDRLKRNRGRRGLALVTRLQHNPRISLSIEDSEVDGAGVDQQLVQLAAEQDLRILTTDYNLNRVAQIRNVTVLNVNDLSNTLKMEAIPGETLTVDVIRRGEAVGQGVGYMPDGTMVVIEQAAEKVGQVVVLTVTNVLQTSAGKMIFGTALDENGQPPAGSKLEAPHAGDSGALHDGDAENTAGTDDQLNAERLARSATQQPRHTDRPADRPGSGPRSRRNPRR